MPTVATGGTELYYERSGAGPRLVFLLGSSSNLAGSHLLVDLFTPRFDVVVHDYRGLGRSGPTGAYDMATCAADTLSVMDAVGWDSARVIGVSFGGMVAQELAVTAPGRVERLALLCTSPGGAGGSSYPLDQLEGLPAADRMAARRRLADTRFDDEWLATHPADRRLVELMAERTGSGEPGLPAAGVTAQLAARAHHDVWDRLGAITCPTLVACGRTDGIAPPANSEAIVSRVRHAELRTYDGGHLFLAQDPTALPDAMSFLAAARNEGR